jgi:hypothetical protein
MPVIDQGHEERRTFRTRGTALAAVLLTLFGLVGATPAMAGHARGVHLSETQLEFTYFLCRPLPEDHCVADVRAEGHARSNLDNGEGTVDYVLVVDFFNGFDDPCNRVHETATFTFPAGSITTESDHVDCASHGLRIDTPFVVTGATGAFTGATGAGREFGAADNRISVITYNGTITY